MTDDILGTLTYETARELIGRTYRIDVDGGSVELTVTAVRRAAETGPRPKELKRTGFSIFFRGPASVMLQQRMYDLQADGDSLPHLFIVPVGRDANGYEYEAVFT
jgi:hypothetical protein